MAPPAWVWGVRGRVLSHPRPLVLSGVRPVPNTPWLWVRQMQAWGPVTNPTARSLASWLCALWGPHEGAWGGRLLPGCRASGVGRSLSPDRSSFRACGRGTVPTGCGCGGCRRGDPSPTPPRALPRVGFARCGGGMRVPAGGASCLGVGRPGTGTLPPATTRPFWRAAGAHYRPAVGAEGAGVGTCHQPEKRTLLGAGFARCGGGMRVPREAASCLGVGPQPLVLSGVRPGPTTHWLLVRGVRAWRPDKNPTARALASWLCALCGRHEGAGGGGLLPGSGASGDGCSPTSKLSSLQAYGRGPHPTGRGCGGCGRGYPSPTQQRALLRAGFACCGGGMRVPAGGASCQGVGRLGSGALPPPLVFSGERPGPTTHWLWVWQVRA